MGADEVGDTGAAKRALLAMFPETQVFDTPKPLSLLERIVSIENLVLTQPTVKNVPWVPWRARRSRMMSTFRSTRDGSCSQALRSRCPSNALTWK